MIPLMVGTKKLGQHMAHGTSLVALLFTGVIGALTYASNSALDIWAAIYISTSALLPTWYGARHCHNLAEDKLKKVFGIFLILIPLFIVFKHHIPPCLYADSNISKILILLLTGAVTGYLSGLMGVGGGPIMIAGMVLLAGFDQHTAQGSSLLAMVPIAAMGSFSHWRIGSVDGNILKVLIPGIIIGTFTGGWIAQIIPEFFLRVLFASVLIWTGIISLKSSKIRTPTCD